MWFIPYILWSKEVKRFQQFVHSHWKCIHMFYPCIEAIRGGNQFSSSLSPLYIYILLIFPTLLDCAKLIRLPTPIFQIVFQIVFMPFPPPQQINQNPQKIRSFWNPTPFTPFTLLLLLPTHNFIPFNAPAQYTSTKGAPLSLFYLRVTYNTHYLYIWYVFLILYEVTLINK